MPAAQLVWARRRLVPSFNRRRILLPEHPRSTANPPFGVRRHGTVRWFKEEQGYGRISADDGELLWFHIASMEMRGYRTAQPGDRVSFIWTGAVHAGQLPIAEEVRQLNQPAGNAES